MKTSRREKERRLAVVTDSRFETWRSIADELGMPLRSIKVWAQRQKDAIPDDRYAVLFPPLSPEKARVVAAATAAAQQARKSGTVRTGRRGRPRADTDRQDILKGFELVLSAYDRAAALKDQLNLLRARYDEDTRALRKQVRRLEERLAAEQQASASRRASADVEELVGGVS